MSDTITSEATTTHGVQLSDAAAGKVASLLEQEGRDDLRLRLAVQPGGCSGLIYQLYFDERLLENDALRDFDGVEVVVDTGRAQAAVDEPVHGGATQAVLVVQGTYQVGRDRATSTDNGVYAGDVRGGEVLVVKHELHHGGHDPPVARSGVCGEP